MRRLPAALRRSTALERSGARFANIADVGTGTGILAFAALALWPEAKCIATDIDSQAINVARENAAINGVTLGHGERRAPARRRRRDAFTAVVGALAVRPDHRQHPCGPLIELRGRFRARPCAGRDGRSSAGLLRYAGRRGDRRELSYGQPSASGCPYLDAELAAARMAGDGAVERQISRVPHLLLTPSGRCR